MNSKKCGYDYRSVLLESFFLSFMFRSAPKFILGSVWFRSFHSYRSDFGVLISFRSTTLSRTFGEVLLEHSRTNSRPF